MNAENPVQIDLFDVSATGTKDTRLAEQLGGYRTQPSDGIYDLAWPPGRRLVAAARDRCYLCPAMGPRRGA